MTAKRRALAERRRMVGHTQEKLAALLGVERSTVVRWEAGDILLLSFDECSPTQIGVRMERFAALDIASRRAVLQEIIMMSGAILLQPVHRWLAQELAAVPMVSSSEPVGNDALERAVAFFRRWDFSGVGGLRRKAVAGQLSAVAETLHEPQSPAVSRRLFHIAAELAQLAGIMASEASLPGVAQRYYLLALGACQKARAPLFGAKILGDMARLSQQHSHYEDSLELLRAALYIVPRNDSALVRTQLLGVESVVNALLGDQAAATRAADACLEVWQDAQNAAAPDWQRYMNQAQADALAADTYLVLALRAENGGRAIAYAERAERHVRNARASRPQGFERSRVLDEIRLAEVRLAQHDLAESVAVAQSALELAAPLCSTMVCRSLFRLHGELTVRYPGNVHVIPLTEQLHEYMKWVAPHKERGAGTVT